MIDGGDFVRITNREIYDGLREVQRELALTRSEVNEAMKQVEVNTGKIRALEVRYYSVLAGLIAVLGATGLAASGVVG